VAARANHPLKTLFLLACLAGAAWLAYEFVYVRRIFHSEPAPEDVKAMLDDLEDALLEAYESDTCILDIQRPVYRPRENHFRVNIVVDHGCVDDARNLCRRVAEFTKERVSGDVSVYAHDRGGVLMAKWID